MLENLQSLIAEYGYVAVSIGCFFEGETALLLGALASQQEILSFPGVLLAALIGTILGDNCWFYLGRYLGQPFIARHPRWQARAAYAKHHLDRYGAGFIIGLRFFYGLRSVTPFVMGAARVSRLKFFLCDLLSAIIWLAVVGSIIYALGTALESALVALESDKGVFALIGVGLALFAAVACLFYWRARLEQRVRREEE